jgi:very-short-patch-repair endonuclease
MSLNAQKNLTIIAKTLCRELRKKPTMAESILWELLRNRNIVNAKFFRQYPLFYDLNGKESFFIADFYNDEKKLVIELDGEYHKYRLAYDAERTSIINYLGITVLRCSNDIIINSPSKALNMIMRALMQ